VVRIRITSPARTGSASAERVDVRSWGHPGSMTTLNGRPARPPFTPQQDSTDRSAMDMKLASRSIRMCLS
jgi:hypothetical protein